MENVADVVVVGGGGGVVVVVGVIDVDSVTDVVPQESKEESILL